MTVLHVTEDALAYWGGTLHPARLALVEAHLAACAACRAEFDAVGAGIAAVRGWSENQHLPPRLERRILAAVQQPTLAPSTRLTRVAASIIVALAAAAGGFALGRSTGAVDDARARGSTAASTRSVADSAARTYLLLLEEREWPPSAPLDRAGYREWARAIAERRRFVSAQKLTDDPGFRVRSSGEAVRPEQSERPPNVSGWYLVIAGSYEEAIAIARLGPHLRYGSVLVRQVE